jgi:hypothetical protein
MEEDSSSLIDYYISLMGVIRVLEHETKEVVESEEGGETQNIGTSLVMIA